MEKTYVTAIIVAAGSSTRMGGHVSKQLMCILGKSVIEHTLNAFENAQSIDDVVIVARDCDREEIQKRIDRNGFKKIKKIVTGGKTRSESVRNGIAQCDKKTTHVAIHDGARPLVTPEDIENVVDVGLCYGGATLGTKVIDTIKMIGKDGVITSTPDRDKLVAVQTPQVFRLEDYISALDELKAKGKEAEFTDDCAIFEATSRNVKVVEGSRENIKITTAEDITTAENIMRSRRKA